MSQVKVSTGLFPAWLADGHFPPHVLVWPFLVCVHPWCAVCLKGY